jgi:subtilisin family serine protease
MRKVFLLSTTLLAACWATPDSTPVPLSDKLEIKSVQPRAVDFGDTLTISGTGFVKNLSVRIGSQSVTPLSVADTQVTMKMPNLGRGQYQVEIKNPDGATVTRLGPVVLGKDQLTSSGPGSVPSVIEGQVMISIPATDPNSKQNFPDQATLERYLKDKYPNFKVRVVQFYSPIVPGSNGPCGKSLAVLESTDEADTKAILNELATKFPELNGLELVGDGHSQYSGSGLQGQFLDAGATNWPLKAIQMPDVKEILPLTSSLSRMKVAVLDTGVSNHPEFENIGKSVIDRANGKNFTSEVLFENRESSEDGYVPDGDLNPANFIAGIGGHGTPIAAIIAALDGNQIGKLFGTGYMIGVAPGVQIIPVKVCYREKETSGFELKNPPYCPGISVAAGICHAIAKEAKIINLSLGGPQASVILYQILKEASDRGISIVAAAGNEGKSILHFPAAFGTVRANEYESIPGLIAVGAVSNSPTYSGFYSTNYSNKGNWVDIVAPGGDFDFVRRINSAANSLRTISATYTSYYGTSFAAPFVSGAVALIRAKYPNLTLSQIKEKIKASASNNVDQYDSSREKCAVTSCGAGLLNVSKSLDISTPVRTSR